MTLNELFAVVSKFTKVSITNYVYHPTDPNLSYNEVVYDDFIRFDYDHKLNKTYGNYEVFGIIPLDYSIEIMIRK